MKTESPNFNTSEKIKTPEQLARKHINLELEEVEGDLKNQKFWGRVEKTLGVAGMVSGGMFALGLGIEIATGTESPELHNFLTSLSPQDFVSFMSSFSPDSFSVFMTTAGVASLGMFKAGRDRIKGAVQIAKDKKNHVLSQYLK